MKLTITLLVALATVALGQSYVLRSVVLDGGGVRLTSSGYAAGLSVAQDFASPWLSSDAYRAIIGFWHGPYAPAGIAHETSWNLALPTEFRLSLCTPNPFRSATSVAYSLPVETDVRLRVFDHTGRTVGTLVNGRQQPGCYHVTWNIAGVSEHALPNGVYFLRLEAGAHCASSKVAISR